jgi:starch phosphorylase
MNGDQKEKKLIKTKIGLKKEEIAYFSMEIGLANAIPTYSGGLGVLAGDTIRSAADLSVPMVAVSLIYKQGFFNQKIDAEGNQQELPVQWQPARQLYQLPARINLTIDNRTVKVQAWQYECIGTSEHAVAVIFLDTDLEENDIAARRLCYALYDAAPEVRLAQEMVLGIGGVRMLKELGYNNLNRYHMNEGHSSLLTLELLNQKGFRQAAPASKTALLAEVKKLCVFTTHTPVPAGHDQFPYTLVKRLLGDYFPLPSLKKLGGKDNLNMTMLALNLSGYVNGVAKEHGEVSREMFPGYKIDSITNGIHSLTWVSTPFKSLFDKYLPGWRKDFFSLRYALTIPGDEIWSAHQQAKAQLLRYVYKTTGIQLEPETLTLGFARRATAYKRWELLFYDTDRLLRLADKTGKIQIIYAGKAHPMDFPGKQSIKQLITLARQLQDKIKIVFLPNYDMDIAGLMVAGTDLWLNTPRKPQEASGTSGMKAAHNGVPSLSVLDGWWIEGCLEGYTGWAIGSARQGKSNDAQDAAALYDKLEKIILPMYYDQRNQWTHIMRYCIAINGSFFNSQRMVMQYVLNAYLA